MLFKVGDIVKIREEWTNKPEELDRIYEVVNVNEVTSRCIIECQNSGMHLAPQELVGENMIELVVNE